jgi:hypothetical protein
MQRTAILFLINLSLVLGTQNSGPSKPDDSVGAVVREDSFEGVIFPAEKRALDFASDKEKYQYWTPSEADIMEAEKKLLPFLPSDLPRTSGKDRILKDLKTYKRQYVGLVTNDEKEVFINFFCTEGDSNWTRHVVWVSDGGPCFFHVYYSMKSKTFSRLMVNGYA